MSVLLDSCVVIDVLRANERAVAFVAALPAKPFVSPMALLELHAGFRSHREEREGERVFGCFQISRYDDLELWRRAGQHMKHFGLSHGLDEMDALIAATAEHHGLELATLTVKHFPMFKKLKAAY